MYTWGIGMPRERMAPERVSKAKTEPPRASRKRSTSWRRAVAVLWVEPSAVCCLERCNLAS
jgi:hypothetical protein